jgi:histone deacetylase 6
VPDLIKIYRADHLFRKYELCVVPLASAELEANFGKQVIVRCDVVWVFLMPATMYTNQERWWYLCTICKFKLGVLTGSGNLRIETDGLSNVDVKSANSYLVSCT